MKEKCPTCRQMVAKQGMRMHQNSKVCINASKNPPKAEKQSPGEKCDAVGRTEHEFRLLKSNVEEEDGAMEEGYTQVCKHCLELK